MLTKTWGETPVWPPRGYAWYVVSVLSAAYTLSLIDRQVLGLLFESIRHDFSLSDTQVSLLAGSAFALFYVTVGVPLGRIADRANRRYLIFAGVLLWSLMTSACGFATNFWQLFAARVGVGVGEATLTPAALSIISDYFRPEERGRPLAMYFLALAIGAGLAYVLGGGVSAAVANMPNLRIPLLGSRHAWQLVFIAVGAPGGLFALVILTIREPLRRGVRERSDAASASCEIVRPVPLREVLRFMWRDSRQALGPLFLAYGGINLFADAMLIWMPTVFVRRFGWSAGDIGLSMGMVILVSATVGILSGIALASRLQERGSANALMRTSFIMGAGLIPFGILLPLATKPLVALALMAPAVALSFGLFPMGPAILQLITPNQMRGQVAAVFSLLVNVMSLMVGTTSVALLTDYVFHDRMRLHQSLAIVAGVVLPLSTFVMWWGLVHVEKSIVAARSWIGNVRGG